MRISVSNLLISPVDLVFVASNSGTGSRLLCTRIEIVIERRDYCQTDSEA